MISTVDMTKKCLKQHHPILACLLVTLGLFLVTPRQLQPQTLEYDTSGLTLFWEVADILASDRSPSETEWERLLSHPGYEQIERKGSRAGVVRRCMPLVFQPSRRSELDVALEEGNSRVRRSCAHLEEARQQRDELERFAADLSAEDELEEAVEMAGAYLPEGSTVGPAPSVFVILFEPNGFGGASLALDALLLHEMPDDLRRGYLAHELHHGFRDRVDVLELDAENADARIADALSSLATEGIASLLDKRRWLEPQYVATLDGRWKEIATTFGELFEESAEVLADVDSKLVAVADGEALSAQTGSTIKGMLPWGGHPTGMYMALAIEAERGSPSLATLAADPLQFILAYQEVAQDDPALYALSDTAIAYVRSLWERYRS